MTVVARNDGQPECDLVIAGMLVPPEGEIFRGEVRITAGKIIAVVEGGGVTPARQRLDVGDAYVLPGAVDAHVHCLSNPGEGIEAATRAAAAGGVTTIIDMPYDSGNPVNRADVLLDKIKTIGASAMVDVGLLATVSPDGGAGEVGELVRAGACGFKLSLFDTDSRRFPRIPDRMLLDVLAEIAAADSIACIHAENDEIIKPLIAEAVRDGRTEPLEHCRSRPPVSESEAVLKALEFGWYAGVRLHLCHLSLTRSAQLVRRYAADGLDVSSETCPHYLVFSESDMAAQGARLKINPPLRSRDEREGLWALLADGAFDIIGSDHAPWSLGEKSHPNVFDNHSGVPGVETLVPLVLSEALRRGWSLVDAARLLSTNPARRFRLPGKGMLATGADADVMVFAPGEGQTLDESRLHSNAGWSPYGGMRLGGRVSYTVSRGEIVWDGQDVLAEPGRGRFLSSAGLA